MAGKLTARGVESLAKRKGRFLDSHGLFLRVLDPGKRVYWVFRYRIGGKDRETSIGSYPAMTLAEARTKHKLLVADVARGIDPLAGKHAAKFVVANAGVPTFGVMAIDHVETHESGWRSHKHRYQWRQTLTQFCQPIWLTLVDQVDTQAVLACLKPIWATKPVTASRLRGRIETVIDAAQALGHIGPNVANPARWKGHLQRLLPKPAKLTHGHHAAMPYADLPEFMKRLSASDKAAARALMLTVLTCVRTSETLGMRWDEVDLAAATWIIPKERMKMQREHVVPLSSAALDILRAQEAVGRGRNPHIFAGRPMKPLSNMSMAMLMRRMGANFTVHGMRSAARSWMADQGVPFELAEACLAHTVGSAVVQAYQRSSMLERRRPIMESWSRYVSGADASNVVPIKRGAA